MTEQFADPDDAVLSEKKKTLLVGDVAAFTNQAAEVAQKNAELIQKLKNERQALKDAIAGIQRDAINGARAKVQSRTTSRAFPDGTATPMSAGAPASAPGTSESELHRLTQQVAELRKEADQLKHDMADRQTRSDRLRDVLHELELQTPASQASAADTPDKRKIRSLENRLDKIIIKYNEAQSIHKTYEQIVKRLKEERVSFDTQLEAIEQTLRAKEQDYEELLLMAKSAQQARELAKSHLRDLREEVSKEEAEHAAALATQRAMLAQREEQIRRHKQRAQGGDQKPEESGARSRSFALVSQSQSSDKIAEAAQDRMMRAEDAFRRIKEATGDDDVNRVIQKYITQERDRRESEINLQKAKEALAQAQDELRQAQRALNEVAASENLGNKRIEEETAAKVGKTLEEEEDEHKRFAEAQRVIADVKEGLKLLIQRVHIENPSFTHPLDPEALDARPAEVLEACRERALFMQSEVSAANVDPSDVKRELEQFARHNVRISFDLPKDEDKEGAAGAGMFGGASAEEDSPALGAKEDRVKDRNELRREALEKASVHTQGSGAGKGKRGGRGGRPDGGDEEDDDA